MSTPNPYTPELIAAQLEKSVREAVARATADYEPGPDTEEMGQRITEAFLSGCSLTANFLTRTEGQTSPQLIERGLSIVGKKFGMEYLPAAQANTTAKIERQHADLSELVANTLRQIKEMRGRGFTTAEIAAYLGLDINAPILKEE